MIFKPILNSVFKPLHRLLDNVMAVRAQKLARLIVPHVNPGHEVLDVGSGTGHNAIALNNHFAQDDQRISITQVDVYDMSTTGHPPTLISGTQPFPFDDNHFDISLMIFMLQYPEDPVFALKEAARTSKDSVILIQSTYEHQFGNALLHVREFFWGRLALFVSRAIGYVQPPKPHSDSGSGKQKNNPLAPSDFLSRKRLMQIIDDAQLVLISHVSRPWWRLGLNRDVYILEKQHGEKQHG